MNNLQFILDLIDFNIHLLDQIFITKMILT